MTHGGSGETEGGPAVTVVPAPQRPEALMDVLLPADGAGESFPPGEPPERVRSELLWRVATRLFRDHDPGPGGVECASCRQPWPCSGRRLAELGLIRAAP